MAATVLYDEPGPRARSRQRLYTAIFLVVSLALIAWVAWKLDQAAMFQPELYDKLSQPNIRDALVDGVRATVEAAAMAIALAVLVGFVLAFGRLSDHRWVSWPCRLVVEFFRAVPVLLLIVFIYALTGGHGIDTDTRRLVAVVGGLMLYNGSVLAEVFRAGINAVPKGQLEAAYAIGMRKSQVMRTVLTPQAVRYMMPAIISQCVVALKDTSLGFIVAYLELLRQGKLIAEFVNNYLIVYLLIAVIYIALNSAVGLVAELLERRLSSRGAQAAAQVAAAEEQVVAG